jgi:hypothetical protein
MDSSSAQFKPNPKRLSPTQKLTAMQTINGNKKGRTYSVAVKGHVDFKIGNNFWRQVVGSGKVRLYSLHFKGYPKSEDELRTEDGLDSHNRNVTISKYNSRPTSALPYFNVGHLKDQIAHYIDKFQVSESAPLPPPTQPNSTK